MGEKKMFFPFFIFSIAFSLPSDIPPSQPFSDITDGKSYWSLSENFQRLSENYQSCLVQKAEILGTLKQYQATFVNHVSEKINELTKDVKEISTSNLDHSERITVLEKSECSCNDLNVNFDPKEVYFNFGPKHEIKSSQSGVMKFDEDRGSGKDHSYDPKTGYFTVQYEGLYFFSLSFLRSGPKSTENTEADIRIDDKVGCQAFSEGDKPGTGWHRDTVSCSVVKRLKPGQKVAVFKPFYFNGAGMRSVSARDPDTEFLGYMIR